MPRDKARQYGGSNRQRCIKLDSGWPTQFQQGIRSLADEEPLAARLLEAWVLQKRGQTSKSNVRSRSGNISMEMLTDMDSKEWWKKERVELALIQIASRCQQRPIWAGYQDIIDLSGGNVLTFLSICQFIWETHNQVSLPDNFRTTLAKIDDAVQAIGIFKASNYWLEKITQETGRGGDRYRMVKQIGTVLARGLYADRKLSYPGHNGFSLVDDELEGFPHVKALLDEMSDYGALVSYPHTTKERDRKNRHKYYLSPVLCPRFQDPI